MLKSASLHIFGLLFLCGPANGFAQTTPESGPDDKSETGETTSSDPIELDDVIITHSPKKTKKVGGSAHVIQEDLLETFEYDNAESVLQQVPGVYIRSEDGFGLRPNIGLRGANSERSKKVTLMEDGILFAPAPYSAPAAYYFPMMQRVTAVEVYKGPGAILFGPNTIGGAINLVTRPIPEDFEGMVDLGYGMTHFGKLHAHYGGSTSRAGFLSEGVLIRSSGFKELDGGGDTGFTKTELTLKGMLRNGRAKSVLHRGDIKIGVSHEVSNETYLGLSDEDFSADPNRRYRASQKDRMENFRYQGVLGYTFSQEEAVNFTVRAYHSGFQRGWNKVNGFANGPSLSEILADPSTGQRQVFYDILRGKEDSASAGESLILGLNAREFWVQGIDSLALFRGQMGPIAQEVKLGARLHHDRIHRDHTERAYTMQNGELVPTDLDRVSTADTLADSLALATYLSYEMSGWNLSITPGIRYEFIAQTFEDQRNDSESDTTQQVMLLGLGTHYALTENFGILAGIHQGFSPTAPGQGDEVQPEKSVNYEAGFRYERTESGSAFEAIGFLNQYSNMVAQCSFSVGCSAEDLDREFNGGEVRVQGVESLLAHRFDVPGGLFLPVRVAYTWSQSEFQSSFLSGNPQLGNVEAGDELPYLPAHQASGRVGIAGLQWGLDVGLTFADPMREVAGSGTDADFTDAILSLDASARYAPKDWLELYLKGENLTHQTPLASRRPYGARPGKPLLVLAGIKAFY